MIDPMPVFIHQCVHILMERYSLELVLAYYTIIKKHHGTTVFHKKQIRYASGMDAPL